MEGFPAAAEYIYNLSVIHDDSCPYITISENTMKILDEYMDNINDFYSLFEQGSKDEDEKRRLFNKILLYPFWLNNLIKDIQPSKCEGCSNLILKYLLIPTNGVLNFLDADFDRGAWEGKMNFLTKLISTYLEDVVKLGEKFGDEGDTAE